MDRKGQIDPNAAKALNDFKVEMGNELGVLDSLIENRNAGEYIPRKMIEQAERQLINKK
ncbi:MAG: small, acid-soluble spore protein, alpha/beta type [Clostridiaceae bacterium]|nr:small, acid-soluble spore protein, alpha/beta type [Clostridiaceae bacterium]